MQVSPIPVDITAFVIAPGAAATFTKIVVDAIRYSFPKVNGTLTLCVAALVGVCAAVLVAVAKGTPLTIQNAAITIIEGMLAAVGSLAMTELHNRTELQRSIKRARSLDRIRRDDLVSNIPDGGVHTPSIAMPQVNLPVVTEQPKPKARRSKPKSAITDPHLDILEDSHHEQ